MYIFEICNSILGFLNILEGCRNHEVEHLIYASSSSVYGGNKIMPFNEDHNVDHPLSMYAATKKSNELLIGNQKKLTDSERLEIEKLIKDRNIARQSNNFELADKLREKLHKKGVILEDKGAESIWKIRND